MDTPGNVEVVMKAYENFRRGDIAALLEQLTEDVRWGLTATAGVPFTGPQSGQQAVAEFFARMSELQEPLVFEPREFVAAGDKVVALGHYRWHVKATGCRFGSDWVEVFTRQAGRIAAFRDFSDVAALAQAHQPDVPMRPLRLDAANTPA